MCAKQVCQNRSNVEAVMVIFRWEYAFLVDFLFLYFDIKNSKEWKIYQFDEKWWSINLISQKYNILVNFHYPIQCNYKNVFEKSNISKYFTCNAVFGLHTFHCKTYIFKKIDQNCLLLNAIHFRKFDSYKRKLS